MAWAQTNLKVAAFGATSVTSWADGAFTNPLTPGSIILVMVNAAGTGITFSVTDTAGNTYEDCGAGQILLGGSGTGVQVFYAVNGSSTASNIVTGRSLAGVTFPGISAVEYTGQQSGNPIDVTAASVTNATTSGTGSNNMFTATATTRFSEDLIYCAGGCQSGTVSAGTNFTGDSLPTGTLTEHLTQAIAGPIAGTFTNNTSAIGYGLIMVALFPQAPIYMLGHT